MEIQNNSSCYICGTEIDHDDGDEQRGVLWGCSECGKDFCEACFKAYCGAEALHSMTSMESDGDILCPGCYRQMEHKDVLDHRIDAAPKTQLLETLGKMLFCGKRLDNGAWETGGIYANTLNSDNINVCIVHNTTGDLIPVDPATVGQYIGKDDINGKQMFEGNIVKISHSDDPTDYDYVVIRWHPTLYKFIGSLKYDWDWLPIEDLSFGEVVGNIHDNILLDRYFDSDL
jgi:uncharacterized phage protein (TIGR01671 family)